MRKLLTLFVIMLAYGVNAQVSTIPTITGSNSGEGEIQAIVAAVQSNDDNLQDSVDASGVIVSANADSIDANALLIGVNSTSFQDSLGWQFVDASFGDGVTNATAHFQSKIDEAKSGKIWVPTGKYLIDSLRVGYNPGDGKLYTPSIYGAGLAIDPVTGLAGGGTILQANSNKPVITIDADTLFSYGGEIRGLFIWGSDNADSSNQDGIRMLGPGHYDIHHNYFNKLGGWGIHFGNLLPGGRTANDDIWINSIYKNDFVRCRLGGIKAVGASQSSQINAITFSENQFSDNYGPGMWLFGTNLNVIGGTIERCDSAGVWISAEGVAAHTLAQGINLTGIYFEDNGGGSVLVEHGLVNTYEHTIEGLIIEGNHTGESDLTSLKATAAITVKRENGSNPGARFLLDSKIGYNNHEGDTAYVDCNNTIDYKVSVRVHGSDIANKFKGIYWGDIQWYTNSGLYPMSHIPVTGITVDDLKPNMYLQQSSAIDITADPQLPAGAFHGQKIKFMGNSDSNTLTLDDGTGLDIGGTIVLGSRDVLILEWFSDGSTWVKSGYEDN